MHAATHEGSARVTGAEVQTLLRQLHVESQRYWESFDTATFHAPLGEAWSPADNVRHLTKSVRAVTQGMRLPRLLLLLAFGRATSASRGYTEVREMYRARLAKGADAGRFAPRPRPAPRDAESERRRIMVFHADAITSLCDAIGRWRESSLDARRLPHPLLGPLTVREMLLFTLYHNRHHLENVQRRLNHAPSQWSIPH